MNNTNTNGHTATAPSGGGFGSREKVIFELNTPVTLKLEFDPPEESRPGMWGEQYQYKLAGNRIAWLEPALHAQLVENGARTGDTFHVCKRRVGRRTEWEIQLATSSNSQPIATAAPLASAPRPVPQPQPAPRPQPQPEPEPPGPEPATARAPAPPEEERPIDARNTARVSGNIMQAALRSAIDAAADAAGYAEGRGLQISMRTEDIRALAITIYIQATSSSTGGKRR
jgi:hypothetical protein